MRNEPKRVTRYPILLSSTRQNNDVASNFFEVWLDDKYQEDFVYCQASRRFVTRQKRHNYNLVRHLKTFNQCNAALRVVGDAPRQSGSISERDGEQTGPNSEVGTCEGEGAAVASTCETERETGSTSTIGDTELETESTSNTAAISTSPLLELEPNSFNSTYQIEAAPSDANLAATLTSEPEVASTSITSEPEAASPTPTSEPEAESTSSNTDRDKDSTSSPTDGDSESNIFTTECEAELASSATEHLPQSSSSSVALEQVGTASLSEREAEATELNSLASIGLLYPPSPASILEEESSWCEPSSPRSGSLRRSSSTLDSDAESSIEPVPRPSPIKQAEPAQGSSLNSVSASQPHVEDAELMQQVPSCNFNSTRLRPKGKRQEIPPPLISPNGRCIKQEKSSDIRTPVQASTQAEYEKYGTGFGVTIENEYQLKTD